MSDEALTEEFPECEPSKPGFRERVARHLAWQHAEAIVDDLADRGLLEYVDAAVAEIKRTLKLADLAAQHDRLAEAESDHHEIDQCRCDVAMQWTAAKEAKS